MMSLQAPGCKGRRIRPSQDLSYRHAADRNFPHWVALPEDHCTGVNFHTLRKFAEDRQLSMSRHGHSVVWRREYYQVFMFADEAHAQIFCDAFGGEPMHPTERGKGRNWSQWNKGAFKHR